MPSWKGILTEESRHLRKKSLTILFHFDIQFYAKRIFFDRINVFLARKIEETLFCEDATKQIIALDCNDHQKFFCNIKLWKWKEEENAGNRATHCPIFNYSPAASLNSDFSRISCQVKLAKIRAVDDVHSKPARAQVPGKNKNQHEMSINFPKFAETWQGVPGDVFSTSSQAIMLIV